MLRRRKKGSVMTEYPNLSVSKMVCFDIETYDPNLEEMGPGVYRNDGYILGVSIATAEGFNEYYPFRHPGTTERQMQRNIEYIREVLGAPTRKLGQHVSYDLDWLENWEHIQVNGMVLDTEIAEALIDENQGKYNLDFMAHKYLGLQKEETEIQAWCDARGLKGPPQKWLWKMSAELVAKYAKPDSLLALKILKIQWRILYEQELLDLFHNECRLIRATLLFRKTGVRIDKDKRDNNALKLQNRIEQAEQDLFEKYGVFNYNSTRQVSPICDSLGLEYSKTTSGNASIRSETVKLWIEEYKEGTPQHTFARNLYDAKHGAKVRDTFLLGAFTKFVTEDGLIHCSFYATRTDNFGTRSGRFSSANPNLQQVPSKGVDEYYGQLSRDIFIPFEDSWWIKIDYSQIEYRLMAHFASGPGSDDVRNAYNSNPDTDYHQYIMDLTGLKRRFAKNLNFGVAYGMGAPHMADYFQWTIDYAYEVLHIYHQHAPFIKTTIKNVENVSIRRGYIRTIMNRRSRLLDKRKAYIMFCRLIQGSAADMMKMAMLSCYDAGVFDVIKPHITVHDEIDGSVPKTNEGIEAAFEMQHLMENCIPLRVPVKADMEVGPNWADVEGIEKREDFKL